MQPEKPQRASIIPEVEQWLASHFVQQVHYLNHECGEDSVLLQAEMARLDEEMSRWRQWASRLLVHETIATQQALQKETATVLYLSRWERILHPGLADCLRNVLQRQLVALGHTVVPAHRALIVKREAMPCLQQRFDDGHYTVVDELSEEQLDTLFEKLVYGDNRLYSKSDTVLLSAIAALCRCGKPYASFTITRRTNGFTCLLTLTH